MAKLVGGGDRARRPARDRDAREYHMACSLPSRRRRLSTPRGVAPEVSAQRGTSGAVNGGGGRSAPDPARLRAQSVSWDVPVPVASSLPLAPTKSGEHAAFRRWQR